MAQQRNSGDAVEWGSNRAYLAKVAATVDVVPGGRVDMSARGGWSEHEWPPEHEWRADGYDFPEAGGGERKTLGIAAKYVTYANFDATPEVFKHKSNVLAEHCKDVGTDFGAIVRSANFDVVIGETDKGVAEKLA